MKPCLGFQQLRLIFGFTIGLMVMTGHAAAAPRCADLMLETIKPTIHDLAQLKVNLDGQMVGNGLQGHALPLTQQTFNLKLNELKKTFAGTYTDQQIVAMIKEEIAAIQKINDKDHEKNQKKDAKARKDRAVKENDHKAYYDEYILSKTLTLDRKPMLKDQYTRVDGMEYVPKLDALFILEQTHEWNAKKSITLLDVKTNKTTILLSHTEGEIVATNFSTNREHFIALINKPNKQGELFIYDIQNGLAKKMELPAQIADQMTSHIFALSISPSGKTAVLGPAFRKGFLIDLQNGTAKSLPKVGYDFDVKQSQSFFIEENRLAYMTSGGILKIANLSRDSTKIPYMDLNFGDMAISRDSKIMYLTVTNTSLEPGVASIKISEISKSRTVIPNTTELPNSAFKLRALPFAGLMVEQYTERTENYSLDIVRTDGNSKIYRTMTLEKNADMDYENIAVDPTGKRIFLQYYSPEQRKMIIEVRDSK